MTIGRIILVYLEGMLLSGICPPQMTRHFECPIKVNETISLFFHFYAVPVRYNRNKRKIIMLLLNSR
jgi:hypothetical protein